MLKPNFAFLIAKSRVSLFDLGTHEIETAIPVQ